MVLLFSAFTQLGGRAGSVSPAVDAFLKRLMAELHSRMFDGPVSMSSIYGCCRVHDM
jgi:hypothetical protein